MNARIPNPRMLMLAAAFVAAPLAAQTTPTPAAGRVSYLSGTMYVQTADNKTRILGRDSSIYSGDVITTEKTTVARIEFGDGSSLQVASITGNAMTSTR